jgi:hypothetical protein
MLVMTGWGLEAAFACATEFCDLIFSESMTDYDSLGLIEEPPGF